MPPTKALPRCPIDQARGPSFRPLRATRPFDPIYSRPIKIVASLVDQLYLRIYLHP